MILPLFVWLSREMEEFYPISHYPMYASVDSKPVWYIYLADADKLDEDGFPEAIPMESWVGVRPARAKKIYQTRLKNRAVEVGSTKGKYYELSEADWRHVGEELLDYFRNRDEVMKTGELPERFALVLVEITIAGGEGVPRIPKAQGEIEKEINERRMVVAVEKGGEIAPDPGSRLKGGEE